MTEDVPTDNDESDSSTDISTVAQDADTLVNNLVSELGNAANDAGSLGITLAHDLGEPTLLYFILFTYFRFILFLISNFTLHMPSTLFFIRICSPT